MYKKWFPLTFLFVSFKLGGIIQPNDGQCHLNEQGMYTFSTIQDYPSISHINWVVKQNAINIIFAVTADHHHEYDLLTKHVEGSSSGVLSYDSSNIVELIKDQFSVKLVIPVNRHYDTMNECLKEIIGSFFFKL